MTELTCAAPGHPDSRITIRAGVRRELGDSMSAENTFVLCDARVADSHPEVVPETAIAMPIGGGETSKSFDMLERVLRGLAQAGIDRNGTLFAFGGGTIGDLGGVVAALWLRGIRLVQVPTTLLAMVDSSVGGKTAINIPEGKNLVGAFWPPSEVWIDPEFLTTLPDDEFRSGLGEVLKAAIGLDADLFDFCTQNRERILAREHDALGRAIELSVRAKIRVVEADFREGHERRLLNLGHTLGHALEGVSGFTVPHGIAVARGIHFAIDLAAHVGAIAAPDADRCRELLTTFGYAPDPLPPREQLEPFVWRDKKREGNTLHFVLPTAIGASTTRAIAVDEFAAAL